MSKKALAAGAIIERWWPFVASLCGAVISINLDGDLLDLTPKNISAVIPNIINILGVALAFIVAIQGVIVAVSNHELFNKLRQLNVYATMISYFRSAVYWTLFGLLGSCLLLALRQDCDGVTRYYPLITLGWIFSVLMAACTCLRVSNIFAHILQALK